MKEVVALTITKEGFTDDNMGMEKSDEAKAPDIFALPSPSKVIGNGDRLSDGP